MEDNAAHQLIEHGGAPHIRAGQIFLRTEAQVGEWLSFRDIIAFGCALRNRFFRCRDDQFAVTTVKDEDIPGFGRCVDDRNGFAVNVDIRQRRLRRHIHVPQIVVNGLIAPYQFTGGGVQRHDRAGVAFLFRRAVAAPDIRSGHAHRQVHEVQLRIIGRRRPGVRGVQREVMFIVRNGVRIFRARIEHPQQFTGVDIKTTNDA